MAGEAPSDERTQRAAQNEHQAEETSSQMSDQRIVRLQPKRLAATYPKKIGRLFNSMTTEEILMTATMTAEPPIPATARPTIRVTKL